MAVTTAGSARVDVSPKASASVSPAAILRRMRLPAPPASHVTPAGQRVTCPRTASELGAAQGGGHARVSTGSDAAAATANASMPTGAGTTRCWQGTTNQARRRDANHEGADGPARRRSGRRPLRRQPRSEPGLASRPDYYSIRSRCSIVSILHRPGLAAATRRGHAAPNQASLISPLLHAPNQGTLSSLISPFDTPPARPRRRAFSGS